MKQLGEKYVVKDPNDVGAVVDVVKQEISDTGAQRVIVDSISTLYLTKPLIARSAVLQLKKLLSVMGTTSMLVSHVSVTEGGFGGPEVEHRLVERLGGGGLIYVTVDKGIEYAESLAEYLRQCGAGAETLNARKDLGILKKFSNSEADVLVRVATYYGVMVRGLDLPERVRHTIFVGVPRFKLN